MKTETKGPLVIFSEINVNNPDYKIIVNTKKIVEEDGCLAIDTTLPDASKHKVRLKVHRKSDGAICNIDIPCSSYAEALDVSKQLVDHREASLQAGRV